MAKRKPIKRPRRKMPPPSRPMKSKLRRTLGRLADKELRQGDKD